MHNLSLIPILSRTLALLCTFTFNVLRSFVKTKSNICQAIEKNECKTLEIEIRRVSALFALPPKCSMSDATAKHTHLPAYTQTKWLRADAYDLDENHHGIKRERERILWQWRQKQCWIRISSSTHLWSRNAFLRGCILRENDCLRVHSNAIRYG